MTILDFAWREAASLPDGVTAVWTYESVGETTDLWYAAAGGSPLAEDTRAYDVFGQARLDSQLAHISGTENGSRLALWLIGPDMGLTEVEL